VSIAIDANVLVRLLVRDDEAQFKTEWVLRSRYKLDQASIAAAFAQLLESDGVAFEHEPTVEEALYIWTQHPSADFADCLHNARAAQLGRTRFVTFDAGAAKLPRGELLAGAA
jgi:predicted nucleic-acid-binding protein